MNVYSFGEVWSMILLPKCHNFDVFSAFFWSSLLHKIFQVRFTSRVWDLRAIIGKNYYIYIYSYIFVLCIKKYIVFINILI